MSATESVSVSDAALLVIDVQEYFVPLMASPNEPVMVRLEYLLALASVYDLPTIATFEHPVETKGWFPERLHPLFPTSGKKYIKRTFDCCSEPDILESLRALGRKQIIVAGAETDVCVLQSVLGLLQEGFTVFLLEDCLFSGEPHVAPAMRRMEAAGAIPLTVKTLFYELRRSVGNGSPLSQMLARFPGRPFSEPEDLPKWLPLR